jgi:hypothetical protein
MMALVRKQPGNVLPRPHRPVQARPFALPRQDFDRARSLPMPRPINRRRFSA